MKLKWFVLRYVIAVASVFFLSIFYLIFKPLTLWLFVFFLSLTYSGILVNGAIITFRGNSIELINACIAGSAYLLLFLLNVLTPGIKFKKRILLFVVSSLIFLVINVIRLLITTSFIGRSSFDSIHMTFWYLSIVFVVIIWFFCVWIFRIKKIPIYSDIKEILSRIKI